MRHDRDPLVIVELVRFACALGVMGLHYGITFWHAPSLRAWTLLDGIRWRAPAEAAFAQGWIGIELFFVLSGLMIARSASGAACGAFLRRRLLRLAPAAWLCATLTLLVVGLRIGIDAELASGWARSVVFLPVLAQVDDSYWTLGIELAFYLLVASVIGERGSRGTLTAVAAAIGTASLLFWLGDLGDIGIDPANRLAQLALLPHGCFFALGMLLAPGGRASRLRRAGIVAAALASSIEIVHHARFSAAITGIATPAAVPLLLFAAGVGLLVAAPAWQERAARWCSPATARRWGSATYPLYLLHQDAGAAVVAALVGVGLPVGIALVATAALAVATALAIAGHAEPVVRRWLAARLSPVRALRPDIRPTASPPAG